MVFNKTKFTENNYGVCLTTEKTSYAVEFEKATGYAIPDGYVLLTVDDGSSYVYYQGTWYAQ